MRTHRLFTVVVGLVSFAILGVTSLRAINVTPDEAAKIGQKIWQNECAGSVEGLVSWNSGEAFPSLGIGHFIWYPEGKRGPFEESFPRLVAFMEKRGVKVPHWLLGPAPWQARAEMLRDTAGVKALRTLLAETVPLQTEFAVQRLEEALPKMLNEAPASEREVIRKRFQSVGSSPRGVFALVDYVNFKGEGVLETERYKGQGWGLLQVLEGMKGSENPVRDFSQSAKEVLARRVHNSPPERHEERWLAGWQARVGHY